MPEPDLDRASVPLEAVPSGLFLILPVTRQSEPVPDKFTVMVDDELDEEFFTICPVKSVKLFVFTSIKRVPPEVLVGLYKRTVLS